MKMFADHDEYANMPQDVKRMKVGRAGSRGGDSSYAIPDDTFQEADKIVAYSSNQIKKYGTSQK
jgi:hypothetical protein